jgi:transcriptional regulator of arginine metabolism
MGIECTQGTVSRDISEMGLGKDSSGRYLLNEDLLLRRMLSDFSLSMTCALNMVVIKTTSGTAQGVAAALDNAELSEVVGTIAGDDTIFIATANEEQAKNLVNVLKMWR